MKENIIKVFIVDDSLAFRKLLKWFIKLKPQLNIVGEAQSGEQLFERIPDTDTDIILMDINMPGIDGIQCTKTIKNLFANHIKVIALSDHNETDYMKSMIKTGASGYVIKSEMNNHLINAIESVNNGALYFPDLIK